MYTYALDMPSTAGLSAPTGSTTSACQALLYCVSLVCLVVLTVLR